MEKLEIFHMLTLTVQGFCAVTFFCGNMCLWLRFYSVPLQYNLGFASKIVPACSDAVMYYQLFMDSDREELEALHHLSKSETSHHRQRGAMECF